MLASTHNTQSSTCQYSVFGDLNGQTFPVLLLWRLDSSVVLKTITRSLTVTLNSSYWHTDSESDMNLRCSLTCNSSNWTVQVGAHKARHMSPKTDSDQVDGAQRETVFLIRPVISDTQHSLSVISVQAQRRRSQSVRDTNLHLSDESSEVVGCLVCVFHCLKIIHIRSSVVPVHYYEIHVVTVQQELYDLRHPGGWRSRGPVPMNDEGG